MLCGTPPPGTEAGRSTDFNILVHLDRIGDSCLTPRLCPWWPGQQDKTRYVENRQGTGGIPGAGFRKS